MEKLNIKLWLDEIETIFFQIIIIILIFTVDFARILLFIDNSFKEETNIFDFVLQVYILSQSNKNIYTSIHTTKTQQLSQ